MKLLAFGLINQLIPKIPNRLLYQKRTSKLWSHCIKTTQHWDLNVTWHFLHLNCERPWLVRPVLVNRLVAEFGLAILSAHVISLFTRVFASGRLHET